MKAAVFKATGENLRIEHVATPAAKPGMLVFRCKLAVLRLDLHAVEAPGMLSEGIVLGHEYRGEVVKSAPA